MVIVGSWGQDVDWFFTKFLAIHHINNFKSIYPTLVVKILIKNPFSFIVISKAMKCCCGLNFLTPIIAARGRSDFLAEIVGRAAGTVLPVSFGPIQVHDSNPRNHVSKQKMGRNSNIFHRTFMSDYDVNILR